MVWMPAHGRNDHTRGDPLPDLANESPGSRPIRTRRVPPHRTRLGAPHRAWRGPGSPVTDSLPRGPGGLRVTGVLAPGNRGYGREPWRIRVWVTSLRSAATMPNPGYAGGRGAVMMRIEEITPTGRERVAGHARTRHEAPRGEIPSWARAARYVSHRMPGGLSRGPGELP
jgi:hypothetical protein